MVKKCLALLASLLIFSAPAFGVEEVCGDGLDNDSSGGDLACPSPDGDHDGYTTDGTGLGYDCDDTSMFMPAQPWTRDGCSGLQAKKCNTSTGAYGSCTTPTEGSTNYYIDATSGSDANPCSFASPCLTFLKFSQYITASPPGGYIDLAAGRTVWILNGTLDETYTDGALTRPSIYTRRSGSSGNPIRIWAPLSSGVPSVTVDPLACDGTPMCPAMALIGNSYVDVRGLIISGGYHDGTVDVEGAGIASDGDNHTIAGNWIKDNNGPNGSNPAGINVSDAPTGWAITQNRLNDNRDTAAGVNENETQIVMFAGTGNDVSYNVVYNTAAYTDANNAAGCIKWKHGQDGASNTITHNRLWNCFQTAIGSGNSGTTISRNLILDSERGIFLQNFGGSTYVKNNVVEYNTIKSAQGFFEHNPEISGGTNAVNTFRYNIYQSSDAAYGNEDSVFTIWTYSDADGWTTHHLGGYISINNNCYYNSAATALNFCLSCADGGLGGNYTFANWKATPGYDTTSFNENPTLDTYHRATATNCDDWGWLQATAGGGGGSQKWKCLLFGVC